MQSGFGLQAVWRKLRTGLSKVYYQWHPVGIVSGWQLEGGLQFLVVPYHAHAVENILSNKQNKKSLYYTLKVAHSLTVSSVFSYSYCTSWLVNVDCLLLEKRRSRIA